MKIINNYKILILIIIYLFIFFYPTKNLIIHPLKIDHNRKLKYMPKNMNDPIIMKEKKDLLEYVSKNIGKNITACKSIFFGNKRRFGNQLMLLSRILFYSELLGCKKIFLDKDNYWFIKHKIVNKKLKYYIYPINQSYLKKTNTIIDNTMNFYFYKNYIVPKSKIYIIKEEIFRNIPKFIINSNDLYIYIRSGDIFIKPHKNYAQPPLCFYQSILNMFKFKNIYIIAENKNNPVINKLLIQYRKIKYKINDIKVDIAYLIYAYNIVAAYSSFLINIIRLNDNLEYVFDYCHNIDNTKTLVELTINSLNNSPDFKKKKKKIILFKMIGSEIYKKKMKHWENTKFQIDLMLNDKCPNNFTI